MVGHWPQPSNGHSQPGPAWTPQGGGGERLIPCPHTGPMWPQLTWPSSGLGLPICLTKRLGEAVSGALTSCTRSESCALGESRAGVMGAEGKRRATPASTCISVEKSLWKLEKWSLECP